MNALLAIVGDTWRQSRQQVVFMIMLGLIGLIVLLGVGFTHVVEVERDDGSKVEMVELHGIPDSPEFLTGAWEGLYMSSVLAEKLRDGEVIDPFSEEGQQIQQKLMEAEEQVERVSAKRRGVEVVIWGISLAIYVVSMLLFIGACSGYFPALLESGAVDIVLAKPLERWKIFLGKYLGGLALFSVALLGGYTLLFVGLGVRTGVWHPAVFRVMPLQVLSAASVFALVGFVGVLRRSTVLAMIVGYAYYVVVDKIIQGFMSLSILGDGWRTLEKILRATVPNFVEVRNAALSSVINAPATNWQAILVMLVWTLFGVGLGYWVFARRDY